MEKTKTTARIKAKDNTRPPGRQKKAQTLKVFQIPNSRACGVSISRAGAGSRRLAAFKIRNGTLEPWKPGSLEAWKPGSLEAWNPEPWNPGTLERWNLGTLEPEDPGTPESWNPGPGTLEPWNAGTLEP